jgi:hypothetical protein
MMVPLSAVTLATPHPPGLILGYCGYGEGPLARGGTHGGGA